MNATLAVANQAYYKPLAACLMSPHPNRFIIIRSICEKYGWFLKLWVASLGDPLPLHSDQRLLNFYFDTVAVAQQSTELKQGFHGLPYPPWKCLIFLEHFGRRRSSLVSPSRSILYIMWYCMLFDHVSPHLIILLSHLHVSIPVKKREVWTNRAGAKSSGRSGSELWTGIQTAGGHQQK